VTCLTLRCTRLMRVSPVVSRLRENDPVLMQLNDSFSRLVSSRTGEKGVKALRVRSVAEGLPSKLALGLQTVVRLCCSAALCGVRDAHLCMQVVPCESANPRVGTFDVLGDSNHINICKPRSQVDRRYTEALELISSVVERAPETRRDSEF